MLDLAFVSCIRLILGPIVRPGLPCVAIRLHTLPPLFQSAFDLGLITSVGWLVIRHINPEIVLSDNTAFEIMRILIALTMTQSLCTLVMGVLQMHRYRYCT